MADLETASVWRPIKDLPAGWPALGSVDLASLGPLWAEQRQKLGTTAELRKFNDRLKRRWAIETGIIEGLYSIDRGITQLLIEQGLDASLVPHGSTDRPSQRVMAMVLDQHAVLDQLFDFVGGTRRLTTSYIKELHQLFTRHQPTTEAVDALGRLVDVELIRGDWKRLPNNPKRDGQLFLYCPPEHVASEMDRLVAWHAQHEGVPADVEAAWLHHRFTQIHPFQDGNGRVARAIASLVFIRAGWFPLTITRDERAAYIDALEGADRGDLVALVELFARIQKNACLIAMSVASDVLHEATSYQAVLQAARQRLADKLAGETSAQAAAFGLADGLFDVALARFRAVAADLRASFADLGAVKLTADVIADHDKDKPWYVADTIGLAKQHGWFAGWQKYYRWLRLSIWEARPFEIVLSFTAIGRDFSGVIVVNAFSKVRDTGPDGERAVDAPTELSETPFQITYRDDAAGLHPRFDAWLEGVVLVGLETWRRGI